MMRPETEVPSDFQDYTLVTVVSVAAHLAGHELGDKAGLAALAARYRQDFVSLEQVFQYVMQSLSQYRSMHQRMQHLMKDGSIADLPAAANGATTARVHFNFFQHLTLPP